MLINLSPKQTKWFLFIVSFLSVTVFYDFLPSILGVILLPLFILLGIFICQSKWNSFDLGQAFFVVLSYYIISLTLVYYIFGLLPLTLSIWLVLTGLILSYLNKKSLIINLPRSWWRFGASEWLILIFSLFLIISFLSSPIYNGSPTPWVGNINLIFFLFILMSLSILISIKEKSNSLLIVGIFLVTTVGVIALRYSLSFGYDTLLNQAALKNIISQGKILPLAPFYIGQYSLEVLLHYFTNWPFVLLERCLVPGFFVLVIIHCARFLSKHFNLKTSPWIIPISVLFLIPTHFTYTSPYAFSLLWSLLSIVYLGVFLLKKESNWWGLSLLFSLVAFFIHPFIGLHILSLVGGVRAYSLFQSRIGKIISLILTFIVSGVVVVFAFGFYQWINGSTIFLADPFFYAYKFFSLFSDPIWFFKTGASLSSLIIYYYEKVNYFLVLILAIIGLIVLKSKKLFLFFMASLSALLSAWLFLSFLEVEQITFGDNFNYSYRLLFYSKWLLWPIIFLLLVKWENYLINKVWYLKIFISLIIVIILSFSWYLSYPRFDYVSRPNVNNIRAVDYKAIELINKEEKGKNNYLVLSNQIIGGGAIQKYGFGPYYNSPWGLLNYYSVPMASELNKRYETIMNSPNFDFELIKDTLQKTNLDTMYILVTDYWPLSVSSSLQMSEKSIMQWNIGNEIFVYKFELK